MPRNKKAIEIAVEATVVEPFQQTMNEADSKGADPVTVTPNQRTRSDTGWRTVPLAWRSDPLFTFRGRIGGGQ